MAIYLSPSTRQFFETKDKYPGIFGCMFNCTAITGKQNEALVGGCQWMLDNGQYKDKWTWALWWLCLVKFLPFVDKCLGIVIPDKLYNPFLTIHFFKVYHHIPKELGYPVAFVTQDGMIKDDIPWNLIDVLFIGGSNDHKRGKEAEILALEALDKGIKLHVGRVQSGQAMKKYWPYAHSFDGTTLAKHPYQQLESIILGIERINHSEIPFNLKLF